MGPGGGFLEADGHITGSPLVGSGEQEEEERKTSQPHRPCACGPARASVARTPLSSPCSQQALLPSPALVEKSHLLLKPLTAPPGSPSTAELSALADQTLLLLPDLQALSCGPQSHTQPPPHTQNGKHPWPYSPLGWVKRGQRGLTCPLGLLVRGQRGLVVARGSSSLEEGRPL